MEKIKNKKNKNNTKEVKEKHTGIGTFNELRNIILCIKNIYSEDLSQESSLITISNGTVKYLSKSLFAVFKYSISKETSLSISANQIIDFFVKTKKDDNYDIDLDSKKIVFQKENKEVGFNGVESDIVYPKTPDAKSQKNISELFLSSLESCIYSAADDDSIMGNINITKDGIYSSNNHQIIVAKIKNNFETLIPKNLAEKIVAFSPQKISEEDQKIIFSNEIGMLIIPVIENKYYPHLEEHIKVTGKQIDCFINNKNEIKKALIESEIFVKESSDFVNVSIQEDQLKIFATNTAGWIKEKITLGESVDNKFEFMINPKMFLSSLDFQRCILDDSNSKMLFEEDNIKYIVALYI